MCISFSNKINVTMDPIDYSDLSIQFGFISTSSAPSKSASFSRRNSFDCTRTLQEECEVFGEVEVAAPTTVKMRKLRGKYDMEKLLSELGEFGLDISFVKLFTQRGRPFAFVDFASPEHAAAFVSTMRAQRALDESKPEVSFPPQQGMQRIMEGFPAKTGCSVWVAGQ